MSKSDSASKGDTDGLNVDFMRSLVKQYSELGQWTSALFWADAAAAAASLGSSQTASGDDIWLLASTMLARGEFHRAAYAVTSRGLHRRHLLCVGVAARALLSAKEPAAVLGLIEECDPNLMEPSPNDQTHNRALAGVLVTRARALCALERREAAAEALAAALKADTACYEALDLLLEQHALTPAQENELLESLPIKSQLSAAEAALLRAAYRERVRRYTQGAGGAAGTEPAEPADTQAQAQVGVAAGAERARGRSLAAGAARARRLAGACRWRAALRALDAADPWCCPEVRAACLVELANATELFTLAHALVDAYPDAWTSWFAVGCYYYLIGKSEFARRYLSKAKSLEPSAGCIWLAYGHSFAADNEHDQAMAAYFKASQLMPGCHLPHLYVGVECTLLNNINMAERFLTRAACLHSRVLTDEGAEAGRAEAEPEGGAEPFSRVWRLAGDAHVAHEAGAAAFASAEYFAAEKLFLRALALRDADADADAEASARWAATLDALGHTARKLGRPAEALRWHERALGARPARGASHAARGLCLALLAREARAADALHAALARDPDDAVALALLDAVVERLEAAFTEQDIPHFAFPTVKLTPAPPAAPPAAAPEPEPDHTNTSDMSMSFD